jgi:hypothetical protein
MNGEFEGLQKEAVVAYSIALRNLFRGSEENHNELQSGYSVPEPSFEGEPPEYESRLLPLSHPIAQ